MIPQQEQTLREVLATLPAGAVIVEGGCYDGEVTRLIMSALCRRPPAAYYAFEPDPRNIARIRAAGLPTGVELIEAAISDTDDFAWMHLSQRGDDPATAVTGSSTLRDPSGHLQIHPDVRYPGKSLVKTVRLDTFMDARRQRGIDLLFTDIEGSERNLVEGGRETLARTRWWWTEAWDEARMELEFGRNTMPYAGMWSRRELLGQLPRLTGCRWDVAAEFEWDVLLKNGDFDGV